MTEPLYEITVDPARHLMRVTWRGLWRVSTVADYAAAALAAGESLVATGCRPRDIRVLVDARALGPQSQDVVAAYRSAFDGRDARVGRIATLANSALFQLQVKRIAVAGARTFSDEAEAMAWLLSPGDCA